MAHDKRVWLVIGSRTPIGSFGRSLKSVNIDKLAAHAMTEAIRRAGIAPNAYDGIILGHGYQTSYTPNTARYAALNAGLPASIPALTVQRQCGSGMEAAHLAANEIRLGNAGLMLAGGAESMSTDPLYVARQVALEWTDRQEHEDCPHGAPPGSLRACRQRTGADRADLGHEICLYVWHGAALG